VQILGHLDRVEVGVFVDAESVQIEHGAGWESGWQREAAEIVSKHADVAFAYHTLFLALRTVGDLLHLDAHWESFGGKVVNGNFSA
jgi:3-deoxy-D-manno-octulosonic acid (KDO) 8-phosphate synthase